MEEAGVEGNLGRKLGTINDPRGGSTTMFVLHVHETRDDFEEAAQRGECVNERCPLIMSRCTRYS